MTNNRIIKQINYESKRNGKNIATGDYQRMGIRT
jgi:hypothetical protein